MMRTGTWYTMPTNNISPDDLCGVCGTARDMHGDKHHKFTLDDDLIPIEPGPPRRNEPPQRKDEQKKRGGGSVLSAPAEELSRDPVANLQIRLIERMAAKGLLDGLDMMYIFGAIPEAPKSEGA